MRNQSFNAPSMRVCQPAPVARVLGPADVVMNKLTLTAKVDAITKDLTLMMIAVVTAARCDDERIDPHRAPDVGSNPCPFLC